MNKPTRNPLVKEMYQTTLRRCLAHEFFHLLTNTLPYAGISFVFSLVAYILLDHFAPTWVIVAWVLPMLFALLYLVELGRLIYKRYLIKKDKLTVMTDTLVGMDEEQVILLGHEGLRRTTLPLVHPALVRTPLLHFSEYGQYVLYENEHHTLERHTVGDTFYLIMYDDKKDRPALVYNANIYELKE